LLPYSWPYLYDEDTVNALNGNGWGSLIDIYGPTPWLILFVYVGICFGLLRFNRWARKGHLFFGVATGLHSPIWGIGVSVGLDSVVGYFMTLCNGAVLVLGYFTSLDKEFNA
jgi:hypothetical protein